MTRSMRRCRIFFSSRISYLRSSSKIGGNAHQYPDIATAAITGPEASGDKLRYQFTRAIGTKG